LPFAEIMDISSNLSNGELKIVLSSEIRVLVTCKENIKIFDGGEKVFLEKNLYNISSLRARQENFSVEEEKPLEKIDGIVFTSADAVVKNCFVSGSVLQMEGEILSIVVYLFDGKLEKIESVLPFKEEFSANTTENCNIFATINCIKAVSSMEQNKKKGGILLSKFDISATFAIFENYETELCRDAFMENHKSNATFEGINQICFDKTLKICDNFESKTEIDSAIHKIICVLNSRAVVTNLDKKEKKIEGIANFCILCSKEEEIIPEILEEETEQEYKKPESVFKTVYTPFNAMLPFASNAETDENCDYICSAKIKNAAARLKPNGECDISFIVEADLHQISTSNICYISHFEVLEKCEDDSLFSIYFKKDNQNAFSVAKELMTSPDKIDTSMREIIFFRQNLSN